MEYFGAIDQGTTSSRFIVFNENGQIISQHQQELIQYFPDEVSVEHDPIEIWESVKYCINEVDKQFSISQLLLQGTMTSPKQLFKLMWLGKVLEPTNLLKILFHGSIS